jgi:aspartokinase-like uncharacterized kinase
VGVAVVVKVGGGLLARVEDLDTVLAEIATASRQVPLVVVPGGGPFADAVRDVDRRLALGDDAAHWMAVIAMDQYAHLIESRLANSALVQRPAEIDTARGSGKVPVLAPFQWLRDVDPLPHSWDVTSDSIAAWVAGQLDAARLVLVKPAGASGDALVDSSFATVLPARVRAEIITADRLDRLRTALSSR